MERRLHWRVTTGGAVGQNKSSLMFINKVPASVSLSNSEGSEKSMILSHVQQRRRRKSASRKRDKHDQTATLSLLPSNNGSDPFYCTIAGLDAGNHAMLKFVFGKGAKLTFLVEAFAPASKASDIEHTRHRDIINERLRRCVTDEALMYSTLAYGSSLQGWMAGIISESRPPEYFIGKALQAVRMRLASQPRFKVDNWIMISIYSLAITQFWNSSTRVWARYPTRALSILDNGPCEPNSARLHLEIMKNLVSEAGGWKSFDPYILESAILADKYMSINNWETPTLPFTWDLGPLPMGLIDNEHSTISMPTLGSGFRTIPIARSLKQAIEDVTDYVHFAEAYWAGTRRFHHLEHHLFLRLQALLCRLLLLSDLDSFNHSIRLTAMIFLLGATEYHGSQVSAATLLPRLRSSLLAARFWEGVFDEGVRLWCLITAAMITQKSVDQSWFLSMVEIYSTAGSLGIEDGDLQQKLCRYLFLPSRQASRLRNLGL
ncbi:unnamed protein product [Clonostachys rosea]|uniref:Transcription factor domain-containing protein n=1 Tax=Bionectria ochroleuca TaxID=29856 RepID=A0ABY6UMD2_BIOOC|nr:unnamed protein product [Clonostachys rosea]